jgi:hypothetical protein
LEEKLEQRSEAETPQEVVLEVKPVEEPQAEPEVVAEEEPDEPEEGDDLGDSELEEQTVVSEDSSDSEQAEQTEEEVEPVLEEEAEEVEAESETEIDEEEPVFKPIFELGDHDDEETEEIEPADSSDSELAEQTASEVNAETKPVALEELLGGNYVDPVFVKPNEVSLFSTETPAETREEIRTALPADEPKTASLNAAFGKSMEIGLNDRVAFVNNLFGESNEDFNRVISQLNTFDNLEEAKTFLNEMVIPDYNYWVGKEEYIERFMAIVEKKFA